jgi:hypothetical protein
VRERPSGDLGGAGQVTRPEQRVREPACQQVVRGHVGRDPRDRPSQQGDRGVRRLPHELLARAGEPMDDPLVSGAGKVVAGDRGQQLPGYPVGGGTVQRQRTPGVTMPGGSDRHRHPLVQGGPDQRMPEGELRPVVPQHTRGDRLFEDRQEIADRFAGDDRQLGHREVCPEQRGGVQDAANRGREEFEAVGDSSGQRVWCSTSRRFGLTFLDPEGAPPDECVDQLGQVQRVAGGAGRELEQARTRCTAGRSTDQLGDLVVGQAVQAHASRWVHRTAQRGEILPAGHRPGRPYQQQRHLPHQAGQPAPRHDGGRVGVLEIVDDQQDRRCRAQVVDQSQQPLGRGGHDVDPVARCGVGLEHLLDLRATDTGRRYPRIERVEQGQQRERLAQLVTRAPEDLAPRGGGFPGRRLGERGLADPRLALDQDRSATPRREVAHPPSHGVQVALSADKGDSEKRLKHALQRNSRFRFDK